MHDQESLIKNEGGSREDAPTRIVRASDPVEVDELAWLIAFALCPLPVDAEFALIEKNAQIQFDYADRIESDFRRGVLTVRDPLSGMPMHEIRGFDPSKGHVFLDDVNVWLAGLRVPVKFVADPDIARSLAVQDGLESIEKQPPNGEAGLHRADDFRLTLDWAWQEFAKESNGKAPLPMKLWDWMVARDFPLPNGVLLNKHKTAFVYRRLDGRQATITRDKFRGRLRSLPGYVNSRKNLCD